MSKFKVGDRVRILRNSFDSPCTIEDWSFPDGSVEVRHIMNDGRISLRDAHGDVHDFCGTWLEDDLELITEGGAQMARKTYKLIKETPTLKKGAIYQEACDDGTQEYILLDGTFIKDTKGGSNFKAPIYDRSLVEEAPQWFVEVFAVQPQFMTREELDQWEAFKATKTKKSVVAKAKPAAKKTSRAWTPERRKAHGAKIKAAQAAKKAA